MEKIPDYSKYTIDDLYYQYDNLDQEKYSEKYNAVVKEIEKRKAEKGTIKDDKNHKGEVSVIVSILGPRNLKNMLLETLRIYKQHFLILWVFGITLAIIAFGTLSIMRFFNLPFIILALANLVILPLILGSMIYAISEQYIRQEMNIKLALRFTCKRMGSLIGANILVALAISGMLVTIIGIPFAIYFMVRWIFVLPAVLLGGFNPRTALKHSSALVKDNWWIVVGIEIIAIYIPSIITSIAPTAVIPICCILLSPFAVIVNNLLYFDLRVRKEGYTPEMLANELHIATTDNIN